MERPQIAQITWIFFENNGLKLIKLITRIFSLTTD